MALAVPRIGAGAFQLKLAAITATARQMGVCPARGQVPTTTDAKRERERERERETALGKGRIG